MLAQITALKKDGTLHFVAGIDLRDDRVTQAAPIVRYMIGWDRARVRSYCRKRNWHVKVVSVD